LADKARHRRNSLFQADLISFGEGTV